VTEAWVTWRCQRRKRRPRIKATDKHAVLEELVDGMVQSSALPAAKRGAVLKALIARELLGSTGVGGGVAIPHVKWRA